MQLISSTKWALGLFTLEYWVGRVKKFKKLKAGIKLHHIKKRQQLSSAAAMCWAVELNPGIFSCIFILIHGQVVLRKWVCVTD